MKKRIITLLAVLALLVVCAAVSVSAADTPKTYYQSADWTCPCCGLTGDQLTFYTWGTSGNPSGQYALAAGNHYFLGAASTSGSTRTISGTGKCVVIVTNNTGSAITHATSAAKDIRFMDIAADQEVYVIGNNATIKGSLKGGNAGGVFQVVEGGTLHLSGKLTIKGQDAATGVPSTGGLIYNNGTVTMDGVTVDATLTRDANIVSGNGGAICNQGTMTIANSTVTGGKINNTNSSSTGKQGGAIYNDGTLTITNSTINGTAAYRGGAISNNGGALTIEGGVINAGYTSNRGGAIFTTGSAAVVKIKDATVNTHTEGSGQIYRGIMVAGGTCYLYGTTTVNSAAMALGDGVSVTSGSVYLSDKATIKNEAGTHYENGWLYKADGSCKVYIDRDWTGSASFLPSSAATLSNHGGTYETDVFINGQLNDDFTFTNATGISTKAVNLYLENVDHDHPKMTCYGGGFVTCRAQLFANGEATGWYLRPQDAFSAYTNSTAAEKYIKLWANFSTTNTVDTLYLDFNGRTGGTWTLAEGQTLYTFDSTADAGEAGVKVTTAGAGTLAPITQIGGKTYVNNAGTIYPVELKVNGVSLRPSATQASMYYSAEIVAHQDAGIDSFGMAVALSNSDVLEEHLYTAETDTTKLDAFNSVLVNGVVKNDATDNAARAAQKIYAKAYIKVGDAVAMSAAADYSLNSLVSAIAKDPQYADRLTEIAAYDWYSALVIEE